MKKCEISEDVLIGHMCRRIPGTRKESCFLWQAVQLEPPSTVGGLETVVGRNPGCPFQEEVLVYIEQKKKNNEKC